MRAANLGKPEDSRLPLRLRGYPIAGTDLRRGKEPCFTTRNGCSTTPARSNPAVAAVLGGMSPQHAIVWGLGASPNDSQDFPWTARYIVASGNLLADFRANLAAESQGRLQVARLYEMTTDPGVRDMLSFLLARDTYHQRLWAAAIEELEAEGYEETPVPSAFPRHLERAENNHQFWNFSEGRESAEGRWMKIEVDGKPIEYIENPQPLGEV